MVVYWKKRHRGGCSRPHSRYNSGGGGLTNRPLKLLDIGCGCGAMLKTLSKYGTAYGTDMSDTALAFCNIEYSNKDQVKKGYLPDGLPFEPESFDIITILDVLEHTENDKASVATTLRLLNPGGFMIATVPAYMSLWSNKDIVVEHKRRYTRRSLLKLLENENCEIVKATYFNSILLPPIFVFRKLNNILRPNHMENDNNLPNGFINALFLNVMRIERWILQKHRFPMGVSVMAVARKKT
ncbi:MAG: class I SAM-dependent methyltransferase [Clostridiales bacterium]|nr:class I SAM-dependent methyltransferase [Clostridiales bacterium]